MKNAHYTAQADIAEMSYDKLDSRPSQVRINEMFEQAATDVRLAKDRLLKREQAWRALNRPSCPSCA